MDAEERVLKGKIADMQANMADYERRLQETPQIEKQLAALSRTLSSTSNRYWVMRDKQFAAEMGETLETQSKGEEMILIEPPRLPLKPFEPNRGAIITLAFLFALVAGVSVTQLADAMDKSIRSAAAIVTLQGVPPLVEVPYIFSDLELAHAAKRKRMTLASIGPVLLASIVIMHFTVFPLDVLWYALANRLGF
jgi:succinoglycan biosynthesis transport protein ExoP